MNTRPVDYFEVQNEFDGFDGRELNYRYDEKKEKAFQAGIWIFISVFTGFILFSLGYNHIKEILLMQNGNFIDANYSIDYQKATCFDENNELLTFDLQAFSPVYEGQTVRLYYTDYIAQAQPANTLISWIGYYAFFGVIFGFAVWRIVVIYRVPRTLLHE